MRYRVVDGAAPEWVGDELVVTLNNGDVVVLNKSAAVVLESVHGSQKTQRVRHQARSQRRLTLMKRRLTLWANVRWDSFVALALSNPSVYRCRDECALLSASRGGRLLRG